MFNRSARPSLELSKTSRASFMERTVDEANVQLRDVERKEHEKPHMEVYDKGESIGGCCDPLNCLPTKRDLDDPSLINRLMVCLLAIVLLWATSLQVAVSVTELFISGTNVDNVYDTCKYALDESNRQEALYLECATAQISTCNRNLDVQFGRELTASLDNENFNADMIRTANANRTQCSAQMTNTLGLLGRWVEQNDVPDNGGGVYEVTFRTDGDCTEEEKTEIRNLVGDVAALSSEAQRESDGYANEAQGTVSRVTTYAKALNDYNTEYVDNKTESIQVFVREAVDEANENFETAINATVDAFGDDLKNAYRQLVDCVTPQDGNDTCTIGVDTASVRFQLESALRDMENFGEQMHTRLQGFKDDVDDFLDTVNPLYQEVRDFYYGARDAFADVGIDASSLDFWPTVPFAQWHPNYPNFNPTVSVPGTFTTFDIGDKLDDIYENVDLAVEDFKARITALSIGGNLADLRASLGGIAGSVNLTPDDYDPPNYTNGDGEEYTEEETEEGLESENTRFAETTARYQDSMAQSLDAYEDAVRASKNATEDVDVDVSGTANSTYTAGLEYVSNLDFKFAGLSGSRIDFKDFMISFGSFADIIILMDYLWRFYYMIVMIQKFWRRGALNVPDVDVRADKNSNHGYTLTPVQQYAMILSSPYVQVAVASSFVLIAVVLFCIVYIPIFQAYSDGCVESHYYDRVNTSDINAEGSGTFITENLYSMSYNYASREGNKHIFDGLDAFNVRRTEICAEHGTDSRNQYEADSEYFQSIINSHQNNYEKNDLLERCVDTAAMDAEIKEACCDADGVGDATYMGYSDSCPGSRQFTSCPLTPTGDFYELLTPSIGPDTVSGDEGEGACDLDLSDNSTWALRDSVFNCNNLEGCIYGCSGVNEEILLATSYECGCEAEFYMHANLAITGLSLLVYIIFQISRLLFISGVCRLLWEYLHPGVFTFQATCSEEGNHLVPKGMGRRIRDFPGLLARELERTMLSYQGLGFLYTIAALAVHAIWIAVLFYAGRRIKFDSEPTST